MCTTRSTMHHNQTEGVLPPEQLTLVRIIHSRQLKQSGFQLCPNTDMETFHTSAALPATFQHIEGCSCSSHIYSIKPSAPFSVPKLHAKCLLLLWHGFNRVTPKHHTITEALKALQASHSLTCSWYSMPMLSVLMRMAIIMPRLKYLLSTILFSLLPKAFHRRVTLFLSLGFFFFLLLLPRCCWSWSLWSPCRRSWVNS